MIYAVSYLSEFDSYGVIQFHNKKITKIESFYKQTDENLKREKLTRNAFPSDPRIGICMSVYDLKKRLQIENINFQAIESFGNYRMAGPKESNETFINSCSVIIREKPSRNSSELLRCSPMQKVLIKKIDREEEVKPYGKHNWYEVEIKNKINVDNEYKGYVFGAFLEPVEVEVK